MIITKNYPIKTSEVSDTQVNKKTFVFLNPVNQFVEKGQ